MGKSNDHEKWILGFDDELIYLLLEDGQTYSTDTYKRVAVGKT